jgi:hypothetical protein
LYVLITNIIFENYKNKYNNNKINTNPERRLLMSESEEIEYVIIVPDSEEYKIDNILKMKRDVNLKLIYYLNENKIKQVFLYFYSYFLIFFFLVI